MSDVSTNVKDRNPRKKWFITFPQCDGIADKESFSENMSKEFPTKKYIIVMENHEKGGVHLHMLVEFESTIRKTQLINWGSRIYPGSDKRIDYQTVKQWGSAYDYLTKPGFYNGKQKTEVDPEPKLSGIRTKDESAARRRRKHDRWMKDVGFEDKIGCPISWGPCDVCDKTSIKRHVGVDNGKQWIENFWAEFAEAMKINDTEEEE